MFDKKQFLLFLVTAALVAACGGGGESPPPNSGGATAGESTEGDDGDGDQTEEPAADPQLAGYLSITANQVLYVRRDRDMYLPVRLEYLEDINGIDDVAPGYRGDEVIGQYPPGSDGTQYAPSHTIAPVAPIAAFGVRVAKRVQPLSASDTVRNQTAVGRLAVELVERSDSPYLDGGQPEVVRYVIDNVELSTDAAGEISARVLPDAEMHVYGRNAAGTPVNETLPVRTDAVGMVPMERIPDHYGDTGSVVMLFDFEKAFAEASSSLDSLLNVRGHFDMRVTLSPLQQFVRPAEGSGDSELPRKVLIGDEITVNDQPPVNGAGFVGHAWIRSYNPNPPSYPGYDQEPEPTPEPSPEPEPAP